MKTGKLIMTTREQQQRYLMNCAIINIRSDGEEFEPKLDNISLLISLVGKDFLEKHYKEDYLEIKKKLEELKNYVSEIVAYKSDISKKIVNSEDITSERFLMYKQALSKAFEYLFFIDEILLLLVEQTSLKSLTIPSHYWAYVAHGAIAFPEEEDEEPKEPEETDETEEEDKEEEDNV